jgi:putative phage-type endonuclease
MTVETIKIESRQQWLALRMRDLTASDIGAAAGVSPYKTPLALYAEKAGLLMPEADSNIMRRGRWMEAAVIEALHDEQPGWRIMRPRVYLRDDELRIGATPDATAVTDYGEVVNVQCKVVARPTYERQWSDGPPVHYVLQALCEGMLQGMASVIAALVVDTYSADLYLHPVPRHPGAEARMKTLSSEFWQRVANRTPPLADYAADADTVAAMWPQSQPDPVLDLSGDNMLPGLLAERVELKAATDTAMQRLIEIDTELKAKLGEHELGKLPGWKVSWKTANYKEFTVPASTRRTLRVTDLREKEST